MLLCCFRDSKSQSDKPRRHKYRDEKIDVIPDSARSSSVSRVSHPEEGGVILAPVTFHPAPSSCDPRSSIPCNRSVSMCSNADHEFPSSLSRQSSQQSSSMALGLVRPHSRDGVRRDKERAPMSKETKRLLKQRSHDSVVHPQLHHHHHQQQQSHSDLSIPFIDESPPKTQIVIHDEDTKEYYTSIVSSPLRQFAEEKRRRSNSSTVSVPNLPGPPHGTADHQLKPVQGSSTQLDKIEEKIQGRGMSRSSASYGIQQMLQKQIDKEEQEAKIKSETEREISRIVASYEEKISSMKHEHNQQIQQILRETATTVNNAKNTFESELRRSLNEMENNLRNQHASEMKKVLSKHSSELESLRSEYDRALQDADEQHRISVEQYHDRDQAWQAEKQDVLAEIQRLKEEANRFIAILNQEEEYEKLDAQLSPAKKQALTKEVESLQLVLDMRTTEVRQLKEERAKLLEQLEAFENTRNTLEKMNARVEDLQAQLEAKNKVERQLSLENSKLETSYEIESKNKARMSMQVEELQWRLKHKLEPPQTQFFSPGSPMSLDDYPWAEMTSSLSTDQIHSYDDVVIMRKPKCKSSHSTPRRENFYSNKNANDVWKKGDNSKETNGFSLSSPGRKMNRNEVTPTSAENNNQFSDVGELAMSHDEKCDQSTEKCDANVEDRLLITADSLENLNKVDETVKASSNPSEACTIHSTDGAPSAGHPTEDDEGLGDINHGSEPSSSPQPLPLNPSNNHDNLINNNVAGTDNGEDQSSTTPSRGLPSSPLDERVPSRIPFSVQTTL